MESLNRHEPQISIFLSEKCIESKILLFTLHVGTFLSKLYDDYFMLTISENFACVCLLHILRQFDSITNRHCIKNLSWKQTIHTNTFACIDNLLIWPSYLKQPFKFDDMNKHSQLGI